LDEAFEGWPSEEADRYNALPMDQLHPQVFRAMETGNSQNHLYTTWEQAVTALAKGAGATA
jgi:hypothetical protein